MKILIQANNDIGLFKFRKELITELLRRNNQVYISIPNGEMVQHLIDLGCQFIETKIDRRGINPLKDLSLLLKYISINKRIQPDLAILYTIKPNIYGGIVCRITKTPYVMNVTGMGTAFQKRGFLKTAIVQLYKYSCKQVNTVFFENMDNRETFIRNKICTSNQACVLNGAGVNLDEYQPSEYPKDNGEIRFLFIGRIMKEKGIEELLEVAIKIKCEFSNVIFDIIGPIEDDYINDIRELQEKGIINYNGYQDDVKPFIRKAQCFILPSYHEGMANTLLECGAMCRPLITSNIPGCREAVRDGETGFLVQVKDAEDLYIKVKHFIEIPYTAKKEMGLKSYEHIKQVFNKNNVVEQTIRELDKGHKS